MNLKNKSIVVTGGAGFVGSHLVDRLIEESPKEITILSNFFLGRIENLKDAFRKTCTIKEVETEVKIRILDLSTREEVLLFLDWNRPDVVFNLAVVPLPTSLEKPEWTVNQNISMTLNLCEALRLGKFSKLIQFSSSEVYGSTIASPMREDHPVNPTTPYGASKLATDHIALSYSKTFGCDVSVIRPFNIYGPRQNMGKYAGLIPLTVCNILAGTPIFINGDGEQTRDYTYVTDIAEAAIRICENPETKGKIVNIGSGKELSINNIVKTIASYMEYTGEIIHREGRPGEVSRLVADISLAKKLIEYVPKVDFDIGIKNTIDWYKEVVKC